jgi:mono/diheme cytochrome c family protein
MCKLLAVVVSIAVAVVGCGSQVGDAAGGAEVFAKMCAACHGPTGKPDAANVARLGVRDLTAPEFRAKVTPELVERQVREGSQNKLMPSFTGAITDDQIRTVAAYVSGAGFAPKP